MNLINKIAELEALLGQGEMMMIGRLIFSKILMIQNAKSKYHRMIGMIP